MPKLYEYFGLIIFFYSNEHLPIHVHGRYQKFEMRAELMIKNGRVDEIIIKVVRGKRHLEQSQLSNFEKLVSRFADDIVSKWVDYFVLGKQVKFEKIERKIV